MCVFVGGQMDTGTIAIEKVDGTSGEIAQSKAVEGTSMTKADISIEEKEVEGEGGKDIGEVGNKVDKQRSKE